MARSRLFKGTPQKELALKRHTIPAQRRLLDMREQTALATVSYNVSVDDTLKHLFPAEVLQDALAGRKVTSENIYDDGSYHIHENPNWGTDAHAVLGVNFKDMSRHLPLKKELLRQTEGAAPLQQFVNDLCAINRDWACATHVLEWLNTNMTLAGIVYYWPSVLALAPALAADYAREGGTGRFRDNPAVAPLLPLIRQTATLIAGALLLPKQEPKENPVGLSFSLPSVKFSPVPGVTVATDPWTVNV